MKKLLYIVLLLLLILVAGCKEKNLDPLSTQAAGPELVSSDPADGTIGITKEKLTLTLTFDQNVRCTSSAAGAVTVDNGAVISKVNAYNETVTIDLSSLKTDGGDTYTVTVPKGTINGFRQNQLPADEIKVSFTMKYVEPYVPSALDPVKTLSNPNASQQAKNVYNFLLEQSGKKTLSGVQSSHSYTNDFVNAVYEHTGKHPALAGYDFIFLQYSPTPSGWSWVRDYNDISAQREQWESNGLVSMMWHWNVPSTKENWDTALNNYGTFDGYGFYVKDTSFDINEAVKEGTWQNDFIMSDIKEIAGYLQLLEDEGIPVIWRPMHEAAGNYDKYGSNGAWFWWGRGGAEPCKQLWRLLYDQLVNVYGLDNLIWVWTVDVTEGCESQFLDWYPGDEYVDILGVDIYAPDTDAKTRQYQALVDLVKGKRLVTVSECGNIPDPNRCMEAGNKWSWWMVWPSADSEGNIILTPENWSLNTLEHWKKVMSSQYTINREDMPNLH